MDRLRREWTPIRLRPLASPPHFRYPRAGAQTAMADVRKLATIVSIDVAGFSRAMEKDDGAAAAAVTALRRAVEEIAAPLGGRIFNTAGDGIMLEFPAASSAVQAAHALLIATKSGERPLPTVRIGAHLGEVIVADNGDLLGHGVNVAARLQNLAEPGAAVISESVRAQLRSVADMPLTPHGAVQLDRMSEKLPVYSFGGPQRTMPLGLASSFATGLTTKIGRRQATRIALFAAAILAVIALGVFAFSPKKPEALVLALLPFQAEDTGPTARGFAESFSTELHDVLAQGGAGLTLLGYATSSGFSDDPQRIRNLRAELNVSHVLNGAILKSGDSLAVNVELIDTRSGAQIWRDRFEDQFGNLYPMQVAIAKRMREVLRLAAVATEGKPIDPTALRLYMSALGTDAFIPGPVGMRAQIDSLKRAVAIQPDFARAWLRLTFAYSNYRFAIDSPAERETARRDGQRAAERYLALAPLDARAHYWAAEFEPEPQRRAALLKDALRLGERDPDVLSLWSAYLTAAGRAEEGFQMASQAATIDPYSDFVVSRKLWRAMALPNLDIAESLLRDAALPVRAAPVRWYHVVMGWLAQDNRTRALKAMPDLENAVADTAQAVTRGEIEPVEDQAGKLALTLARTATAMDQSPANRRKASEFADLIERDIAKMPVESLFESLAFLAVVDGPERTFRAWDQRLRARPPSSGSGVAPDRETSAAFMGWSYASLTRLHRDPRIFTFLARYPILRNEPFPNTEGALESMLSLMSKRPPDFCRQPAFPYDCTRIIADALR